MNDLRSLEKKEEFRMDHHSDPRGTHRILFCSWSTTAATWVHMQAKFPPAGITAVKQKLSTG